jgi:hypothetical protein
MTSSRTFSRLKWAIVVGVCLTAFEAHPKDCTIKNVNLSKTLKAMPDALAVQVSSRRDPNSNEPVLRHTIDYLDGATLVLEQQNCLIHNLRITLLSPETIPGETGLRRLGMVLGVAPVWFTYFRRYDPVAIAIGEPKSEKFRSMRASAHQFSYSMGDRLEAHGESSETIMSFMSTDSRPAQYRSVLSLYIGVGGQ